MTPTQLLGFSMLIIGGFIAGWFGGPLGVAASALISFGAILATQL